MDEGPRIIGSLPHKRDRGIPIVHSPGSQMLDLTGWHLRAPRKSWLRRKMPRLFKAAVVASAGAIIAKSGIEMLCGPKNQAPQTEKVSPLHTTSEELGQGISVYTLTEDPQTGKWVTVSPQEIPPEELPTP